ncbi:MAG: hypothetical protein MUC97_17565, partial [Bernardetiaceae bacterium]|nr:hypothetical protein [Bernardetiaceae bacterium]
MHPYLAYLLQVSAYLTLFWLAYRWLMHADSFFARTRWYLLATALLSWVLPLVQLPQGTQPPLAEPLVIWLQPAEVPAPEAETPAAPAVTWPQGLLAVWALGAAIGLALIGWRLWSTYRLVRSLPSAPGLPGLPAGVRARFTGGRYPTFSFFNYLAWDQTQPLSPAQQRQVLAHELAHLQGRHSLDLLLAELWRAALWFHPVAHLYVRALKDQHEYLADARAQAQAGAAGYGQLMAQAALQQLHLPFASSFYQSPIKARLTMLTKKTSRLLGHTRTALALGIAAALGLAAACTNSLDRLTRDQNLAQRGQTDLKAQYIKEL